MKKILFFIFLSPTLTHASLEQGKSFGQERLGQAAALPSSASFPDQIPQFTPAPPEAGLTDDRLSDHAAVSARSHPSASFVREAERKRGKFFKLSDDPVVTFARDLTHDPLALLAQFYTDCREVPEEENTALPEEELHTCEESGPPVRRSCLERRVVQIAEPRLKTHRVAVGVYAHGYKGGLARHVITGQKLDGSNTVAGGDYAAYTTLSNPLPAALHNRIQRMTFVNPSPSVFLSGSVLYAIAGDGKNWRFLNTTALIDIVYDRPLGPEDVTETVVTDCQTLEEYAEKELCIYQDLEILEGPQTRDINGYPVERPWWSRRRHYLCTTPAPNTCEPFRAQGCRHVKSQCHTAVGEDCVVYTQTFSCRKAPLSGKGTRTKVVCGKAPLCLSGDCVDKTYPLNGEMLTALAQLSVFKELQNQLKDGLPELFKGEDHRCSRNCVDFRDCCGTGSGWGVSLNLAGCSAGEKALMLKRQKKQCQLVGTYCAKKILGVCVEKKTSFCCFGSSFLRVLQAQSRAQIGLGWGAPQEPLCRGLTVDELSRVDFSRLDLSEVFHEIAARARQPVPADLAQTVQSRLQEMRNTLQPETSLPLKGEQ